MEEGRTKARGELERWGTGGVIRAARGAAAVRAWGLVVGSAVPLALAGVAVEAQECSPNNGGLTLPHGFCAAVVAEGLAGPRHMAVAPNGDLFVALAGSRRVGGGGVVALRDADGDGRAEEQVRFGDAGGTGILLHDGYLYFAPNDRVLRYRLPAGGLRPTGSPETIVSGLPASNSHRAKTIAIDDRGNLFVNIGSPSNVCSGRSNRGQDLCPELRRRAGVWRFDADRPGQRQADGERHATGIRNAVALRVHPTNGGLYAVVHGRDRLFQNWPQYFDRIAGAEKPAEEFIRIERGDDFGWPYCFYDPLERRKVLAPEYGGDGRTQRRCQSAKEPVFGFPGHWAPDDLLYYTGGQFPERYRQGVFVSFHGSWNRAPEPQAGYNVTFLPLNGDRASGGYEVFAGGFRSVNSRPVGLAQAPDGSVYVSDDAGGRIWRIMFRR